METSIWTLTNKPGNKIYIENYRSISIMCAPSKLFEQILYGKWYNHVGNAIINQQHGSMSKKTITMNLFTITKSANDCLEQKKQLDNVLTHFNKTFDRVNLSSEKT